jgi:hypothetical protein
MDGNGGSINQSLNELAKEAEDIKPGQEQQIDYEKQKLLNSSMKYRGERVAVAEMFIILVGVKV